MKSFGICHFLIQSFLDLIKYLTDFFRQFSGLAVLNKFNLISKSCENGGKYNSWFGCFSFSFSIAGLCVFSPVGNSCTETTYFTAYSWLGL